MMMRMISASPALARTPAAERGKLDAAPQHLRHERDHAGEDDGDDQEPRVAVDDVGEFMRQYRLKFRPVQGVEQPARHRDGVALVVDAARVRVHLAGIDDVEPGHGQAARDAEIFEQIVKLRLFLARHGLGACRHVDDRVVEEIADQRPHRGNAENDGPERHDGGHRKIGGAAGAEHGGNAEHLERARRVRICADWPSGVRRRKRCRPSAPAASAGNAASSSIDLKLLLRR